MKEELVRARPDCTVFTAVLAATCDQERGDFVPDVYGHSIHGDYAIFHWGIVSRTGDPNVIPPPIMKRRDCGCSVEFPGHCRSLLTSIQPEQSVLGHYHERRSECVLVLDDGLVGEVANWSFDSIVPYTCIMIPPNQRHSFHATQGSVRFMEIWYGENDPSDFVAAGN